MTSSIPAVVPRVPPASGRKRHYPPSMAMTWLAAGWRDLLTDPMPSLLYGVGVFIVSAAIVAGLFAFGLDYILFPAFAGFMVVGPIVAIGLYEKSRRIAAGQPASLAGMIVVRAASGGQILFTGVLLCLLMLLWMRAAVIVYALFFGLLPFPGLSHVAAILFTTPTGWALLIVGSVVGALFAAFSFAISVFAVPMLLDENVDALTAMGTSMALVWNNLPVMLAWGAIVLALFLLSLATGLLGLIVVFPLLGHGTWHAYRAIRQLTTNCCWQAARSRPACGRATSACPGSTAAPVSRGSSACWAICRMSTRARVNLSTRRVTVAWRGDGATAAARDVERRGLRGPSPRCRSRGEGRHARAHSCGRWRSRASPPATS